MFKLLNVAAKLCALFAGLILLVMMSVTIYSVFGRTVLNSALLGDFELVQVLMSFAVAAFLPICQLNRTNIIVDFFTVKASIRTRERLDRLGALVFAAMMGLLTWRTALGGIDAFENGTTSMMMQVPEWYGYATMVPSLALTAVIALYQALVGGSADRAHV